MKLNLTVLSLLFLLEGVATKGGRINESAGVLEPKIKVSSLLRLQWVVQLVGVGLVL